MTFSRGMKISDTNQTGRYLELLRTSDAKQWRAAVYEADGTLLGDMEFGKLAANTIITLISEPPKATS